MIEIPTHIFQKHTQVLEYLDTLKKSDNCLRNHTFNINNELKNLYLNPKDGDIKKLIRDNKLTISCSIRSNIHSIIIDSWDKHDELEQNQLMTMLNSISDTDFDTICQLFGICYLIEKSQKINKLLNLEDGNDHISENIYKLTTLQLERIWTIFDTWGYINTPLTNPRTKKEYITELLKLYDIQIDTSKIINDSLLEYENDFVLLDIQDIYNQDYSDCEPLLGVRKRR